MNFGWKVDMNAAFYSFYNNQSHFERNFPCKAFYNVDSTSILKRRNLSSPNHDFQNFQCLLSLSEGQFLFKTLFDWKTSVTSLVTVYYLRTHVKIEKLTSLPDNQGPIPRRLYPLRSLYKFLSKIKNHWFKSRLKLHAIPTSKLNSMHLPNQFPKLSCKAFISSFNDNLLTRRPNHRSSIKSHLLNVKTQREGIFMK